MWACRPGVQMYSHGGDGIGRLVMEHGGGGPVLMWKYSHRYMAMCITIGISGKSIFRCFWVIFDRAYMCCYSHDPISEQYSSNKQMKSALLAELLFEPTGVV